MGSDLELATAYRDLVEFDRVIDELYSKFPDKELEGKIDFGEPITRRSRPLPLWRTMTVRPRSRCHLPTTCCGISVGRLEAQSAQGRQSLAARPLENCNREQSG